MAYRVKKGSTQQPTLENLPYKGGTAKLQNKPYTGGAVKASPLSKATKSGSIAKKKPASGTGFTAVATNRKTGEKTVRSGNLTPISKSEYNSGTGKMMRTKTPIKKTTTKTSRAKSILDKKLLTK